MHTKLCDNPLNFSTAKVTDIQKHTHTHTEDIMLSNACCFLFPKEKRLKTSLPVKERRTLRQTPNKSFCHLFIKRRINLYSILGKLLSIKLKLWIWVPEF